MAKKKNEHRLYPKDLVGKDYSDNEEICKRAYEQVINTFLKYQGMRTFQRGGELVEIEKVWDKLYRAYKCIYSQEDHSYVGNAQVFAPDLRKAINTIESEATNALFGREDYFSVDEVGSSDRDIEMAKRAYGVLSYLSSLEDYVSEYELAIKQALIFNHTVMEDIYSMEEVSGVYRKLDMVPILDPETGDQVVNPETNEPMMRKEFNLYKIKDYKQTVRLEVRDIYRLFINHQVNDPALYDLVYIDAMSAQTLIELADCGVYNQSAVDEILKSDQGSTPSVLIKRDSSEGGAVFNDTVRQSSLGSQKSTGAMYEVLRYQGLFTIEDEKTGQKKRKQFWIDIGPHKKVLRLTENPIIGGGKTFKMCNYDTMPFEFYSDSAISAYLKMQYEINDKENQSLDAVSANINAPYEATLASGLKVSDLTQSRKKPNTVLMVKQPNSIRKLTFDVPVNHINMEIMRLGAGIASGTGATSLASGAPTGTQADRSGKALDTLMTQTRSQFSKFVRKFERKLITPTLQQALDITLQFFDDEIEIAIKGEDGKSSIHSQSPAEIVGRFAVKVSSGSEFLKERQNRDSMLEFMSILKIDDTFLQLVDRTKLLRDIAKTMPNNMDRYIDEGNLVSKLYDQINQLTQMVEQQGIQNKYAVAEVTRLSGVVKQTDRAAEASPSLADSSKAQKSVAGGS